MARKDPTYKPADIKAWLIKVFGKGIVDSVKGDNLSPWLVSSGFLYLDSTKIRLPDEMSPAYFVMYLRGRLQSALDGLLPTETKWWQMSYKERSAARKKSDLPLASDVIQDNFGLDIAELKKLAKRMTKPAEFVVNMLNNMRVYADDAATRRAQIEANCTRAFLRAAGSEDDLLQMRLGHSLYRHPQMALALRGYYNLFPDLPDLPEGYKGYRKQQDYWRARNADLGLKQGFVFYDEEVGTHAPTSETGFALRADTENGVLNALDALLKPKMAVRVQALFAEVLAASQTGIWFDRTFHPELESTIEATLAKRGQAAFFPVGKDEGAKRAYIDARKVVFNEVMQQPRFANWEKTFTALSEKHPAMGAFIAAVHDVPPAGDEGTYAVMRVHARRKLPLLTSLVVDGTDKHKTIRKLWKPMVTI